MTLQMDTDPLSAPTSLLAQLAEQLERADDPRRQQDRLAEWLEATLKNELGLCTVEQDQDGDIPVPVDGLVVYVRRGEPESHFLTVVALLLEDFGLTPDVQVPMTKTVVDVDNHQIVTSVDLPVIDTLSPRDLLLAIETVADTADYFGGLLQNRFGGATALDA